jgi:hypothetical protein
MTAPVDEMPLPKGKNTIITFSNDEEGKVIKVYLLDTDGPECK